MFNTDFVFMPGKLTTVMDGGAGSSGKGKLGAFLGEHANNWQFACNTFAPQAGHWVKNDDGKTYFYQTLNSCAYLTDKYEKTYVGPGGIIELPALFREIDENNVPTEKLGIHPLCAVLQDKDASYERGETDLDGNPIERGDGTMKKGSTCHGVGACLARRRLRRPDTLLARDIPELKPFLCNTSEEIMYRLDRGQAGMMEIAQGFQLSYLLPEMYPYCTSRNCTVAAGMDDLMVPTIYCGNVILNYRTYPIRISNYKYISESIVGEFGDAYPGITRDISIGTHLTWDEIQVFDANGLAYQKYEGNSGPGYDDQQETTWDEVTQTSGSPDPIMEITSVTKLPRRVFTFSKQNLAQSINHNRTGGRIYISVNFANYVDHGIQGVRADGLPTSGLNHRMLNWINANLLSPDLGSPPRTAQLKFLGTGPLTDDFIVLE